MSLLEQLAIRCQLIRVEKFFDLLVGTIPDGAHLGRWTAAAAVGRCATIGVATPATTAPTTASSAHSTSTSATATATASAAHSTATASVFPEVFHRHYFIGDDRANLALLRGIQFERFRQRRHPLIDHLTGISLLILGLHAGSERETPEDNCTNCHDESESSSAAWNLLRIQWFLIAIVVEGGRC